MTLTKPIHIRYNANGEFGTEQDENHKTYCGRLVYTVDRTRSHKGSLNLTGPFDRVCQVCERVRDSY